MGAPVMAFCRIDDKEIRLREPVLDPDALIVQDPTLLHQVDLFSGLRARGITLINSTRSFDELGLGGLGLGARHYRLYSIPATELALKHVGRSVPNVPLLAGFAAITGLITLRSVVAAIRQKFPAAVAEKNVAAATEAFELVLKTKTRDKDSIHA
jgi:pyruvate ferredoxin oxidoreductase gamma subunit